MAQVTLKGNPIQTSGELPAVGNPAPDFTLTKMDLAEISLKDFSGKNVVLNIFPSVDTPVCALSVKRFNAEASNLDNTVVLCISQDLPFALKRYCGAEGLEKVLPLSGFRQAAFGENYGVRMTDGPLQGLLARSIVVLGTDGKVLYTELVPEIAQEPNYEAAINALKS